MRILLVILLVIYNLNGEDFRKTHPDMWQSTTMDSAIKSLYGHTKIIPDSRVFLKAPKVAANGGAVPVTIKTTIPAKSVAIFQDSNPKSAVAVFNVAKDAIVNYTIKIKLKSTGTILAVVEGLDGNLYGTAIIVEVAVGSCDGGGDGTSYTPSSTPLVPVSTPRYASTSKNIGFSVGGAKDSDNFYENIKNNYTPKLSSLTYEGTFYDHYFDIGIKKRCKGLFCPTYSKAMVKDIYNEESNYYLSVGLNSGIKDFKRKKLNLVVVLDISGSMNSKLDSYAYDNKRYSNSRKTKMELANEAIVSMIKHLKGDDRLGVVLFDERAYIAKPLRAIRDTDIEATKRHILAIRTKGGTDMSAGYEGGVTLFDNLPFEEEYDNRIIFLTDAMPNSGELSSRSLFGMVKSASKKDIYTSFIGIGVDFNSDLVEIVTKTIGANYYSVHSSKDFKRRLDEEFDFMVTPLVFDLKLSIESEGYDIEAVYGVPQAKQATGEILKISTLFPSAKKGGKVKGGIILVKLKKHNNQDDINLKLEYKDANGKRYNKRESIVFDEDREFYDNSGIQKGILLTNYVDLMKNWMIDSRVGCNSSLSKYDYLQDGLISPHRRDVYRNISKWEQKSCPLKVSDGYKKIFSIFKREFIIQKEQLEDKSLDKELKLIESLINKGKSKRDDWIGIK